MSVEEELCVFNAGYSRCGDLQSHEKVHTSDMFD